MKRWLSGFALARGQLRFACCTTLASLLALAVAATIGVGNPWWAAMAVWIVARPGRGLLLERALFQIIGVSLGAAAGAGILHATQGSQIVDVVLLALLLSLCTLASTLWRHTRSFAAALCGITATVIVVLGSGNQIDPNLLAWTRALDQFIGIISACLVIAIFNPPGEGQALIEGVRASAVEAIDVAIATLTDPIDPAGRRNALLAALARVEMTVEDATAGSFSLRRRLRGVFELLGSVLGLLTAARVLRDRMTMMPLFIPDVVALLEMARRNLSTDATLFDAEVTDLQRRFDLHQDGSGAWLGDLGTAVTAMTANYRALSAAPARSGTRSLVHHRDPRGAFRAALRTVLAVLLTGAFWVGTGWKDSQITMLLVGVAVSLFAASDTAAETIRQALFGAIAGLLFAAFWRLGLDPVLPPGIGWTVLAAAPILFAGSLLFVQRRFAFIGLISNMGFLLVSVPTARAPPGSLASTALFLLLGIVIAELAFRWPLASSPQHRRISLHSAVNRAVAELAQRIPDPQRQHLRARLRHIVLLAIGHDGCTHVAAEAGFADLLRAEVKPV